MEQGQLISESYKHIISEMGRKKVGLFNFGKKELTAAQLEGKELEDYISSKQKEIKEIEKTIKKLEREKENKNNLINKKRSEFEIIDNKLNHYRY